jgi:Na+-transporting NADH:ubiquinone oxidoreductase subunit A
MNEAVTQIKKGMNVRLAGAPARALVDAADSPTVAVCPAAIAGLRPRLLVKEGEAVARGAPVVEAKNIPGFRLCAPAGGVVERIEYGERRALLRVIIRVAGRADVASMAPPAPDPSALSREEALNLLLASGYLALLRQRPYNRLPDPAARPRAIFVNGMSTAPFLSDLNVVVRGQEAAFQAGLDLLGRLTEGAVYLCLPPASSDEPAAVAQARGVEIRRFAGPHPAGLSSVHIHHVAPIRAGETVWTARAADAILIGRLVLDGTVPATRIVALGGPGVRADEARHYRVRIGGEADALLRNRLEAGETRAVANDVLAGDTLPAGAHLPPGCESVTVLPEDRSRHWLGWLTPGARVFSQSRMYLSTWFPPRAAPRLGTNRHGARRPMIVTGLYDQFLPMRIWSDYLLRAVLAKDWEEAIALGLLEVAPEDFALPAFVCPSKMDLVGIIRQGLVEAEAEGM